MKESLGDPRNDSLATESFRGYKQQWHAYTSQNIPEKKQKNKKNMTLW